VKYGAVRMHPTTARRPYRQRLRAEATALVAMAVRALCRDGVQPPHGSAVAVAVAP